MTDGTVELTSQADALAGFLEARRAVAPDSIEDLIARDPREPFEQGDER